MDVHLLIEAIVRQTTVLIAQLATASGARTPLAGTANQVFLNLVQELKQQGLGNKVIADMFGLALRTYHNRVQRLGESSTFEGRSIWEAVLDHIRESGPVLRANVLQRFVRDEPSQVRAVLSDLVGSQLIVKTGRGDTTTYRIATGADRAKETASDSLDRVTFLVWVAVHRYGPLDRNRLAEVIPAGVEQLDLALGQLLLDGRVTRDDQQPARYSSERYLIPVGVEAGWEAAVFDHYQAMVTALGMKVGRSQLTSAADDWVGGSTYCYDVWPGHPHHAEVAGFLASVRQRAVDLRERVEAYNKRQSRPADAAARRFTAYVGQNMKSDETEETGADA